MVGNYSFEGRIRVNALVQLGLVNERVAPDALNSSVVREEVTRISQGKRRIRGRPVEKMGMLNGKDGDAQWKRWGCSMEKHHLVSAVER
jgi:hypothetical protein